MAVAGDICGVLLELQPVGSVLASLNEILASKEGKPRI